MSAYSRMLALAGLGTVMMAADAQPPQSDPAPSEYNRRAVAYIYGDKPITREDLGEFLIERYGADKLQLLVNKRIIEHACKERGVEVTPAEVEASLQQDLQELGVNKTDFVRVVLKNYGKTLFEWEQDVIKPRLLLGKLVRDQIPVSEDDLKKMFEHLYGEKVRARVIMWPNNQLKEAQRAYAVIRSGEEEFARAARTQENATLAAAGGQVSPIAKHSFGQSNILEKEAFVLEEGELSRLLTSPEGILVIKCDGRVPSDPNKKFEDERENLKAEFINRRVQMEIPKLFEGLRKEADPRLFLKGAEIKAASLESIDEDELIDASK